MDTRLRRFALLSLIVVSCGIALTWTTTGRSLLAAAGLASSTRARAAEERVRADLTQRLQAIDSDWGKPVFVRIFKREKQLEVWAQTVNGQFALLDTWPICTYSGALGPKLQQGDGQAPEGIYQVRKDQLNPYSQFHLSFNLGYPNAFDQAHRRTGSALMVHGSCVSIGCYAMGDAAIEEIYSLLAAALTNGQRSVQVHALPFRFDSDWKQRVAGTHWLSFWQDLAVIDAEFERLHAPPAFSVRNKRYVLVGAATH